MTRAAGKIAVAAVLASASLLLSACGDAPKARPAALTDIAETQAATSLAATVEWTANVGANTERDALRLSPYVSEKSVFAVDTEGKLTSYSRQTGATEWTVELNRNITSGVSGDDKNIYLASGNGEVFAISQAIGGTLWTSNVSSEVIAAPVAGPDFVVVRSIDGKVYALEKSTGERRWIYSYTVPALSIHGNGRPTVAADGVLVGLDNGNLVALRAVDGRVFWQVPLGDRNGRSEVENLNDLDAEVKIFEPFIYAVNYQGNVAQIDAGQGRTVWSRDVSSVAGLTVTDEMVVVTDEFDTLRAFNRSDGEALWTLDLLSNRRLTGPVAIDPDVIAVGDLQGILHMVSTVDGSIIARLRTGVGAITAVPVLRDEKLYVQGRNGKIASITFTP